MNYIKKMCILRQIRQGFSGDGKTLSGLIKIEQYGKNLAVEVSVINFAPLVSGEYYCLLSDGKGKTEMLTLRGKSLFNLLSDLDISSGFCGIICYVKNDVVPIAYGVNGNKSYDWKTILNATLPPVFPSIHQDISGEIAKSSHTSIQPPTTKEKNEAPMYESAPMPLIEENIQQTPAPQENKKTLQQATPPLPTHTYPAPPCQPVSSCQSTSSCQPAPPQQSPIEEKHVGYDDETVACENYFEEEEDERIQPAEIGKNAYDQGTDKKQGKETRIDGAKNADDSNVRNAFKIDPDGYYLAVKEEVDQLFKNYPMDKTLQGAFSSSEWVRIQGTAKHPQYLVGIVKTDGRARYICYALATEDKNNPPKEIKNVCTFVPLSPFEIDKGFFVIFQSASTGECIRPELA